MSDTDRIEKKRVLRASRGRVWRAVSDPSEFGAWFGVRFEPGTTFAPGVTARGKVTHPGYEHVTWEAVVERVEPEALLSFRWHPYAVDPGVDYTSEPTTLVEFVLADAEGGTELTMRESGFDAIPASRRGEAFIRNGEGWAIQIENVARHVEA